MLCPNCGTANTDTSEFCHKCGHALSSPPARKDTPRAQSRGVEWAGDPIPEWLLDAQNTLPDDLRDPELDRMVRERQSSSPSLTEDTSGEHDRETSLAEESALTPADADSDEWLSSILASRQKSDSSPKESEQHEGPTHDRQEWLSSLLESTSGKPSQTDSETETHPQEEVAERADGEADWLSDLRSSVSDGTPEREAETAEDAEDTLGWLKGSLIDEPDETSEEIPGADMAETRPMPLVSRPEPETDEPESPSWLRSIQDTIPTAFSDEPTKDPSGPDEPQPPREIPEWLQDIEQSYAHQKETPSEETSTPDWLRAYQEDEQPAQPQAHEADVEVPDWLTQHVIEEPNGSVAEIEGSEPEETQEFPAYVQPARDEPLTDEEPAEGQETDIAPAAPTRGWPDTALLSRAFGDRRADDARARTPDSTPEPADAQPAAETPEPTPKIEGQTLPTEMDASLWLDREMARDISDTEATVEMPITDRELPDWLLDHADADGEQLTDAWPIDIESDDEIASEETLEPPAGGTTLDATDVPDWLASLTQDEEADETVAVPDVDAEQTEVVFAQEELPDWLRAAKGAEPPPAQETEQAEPTAGAPAVTEEGETEAWAIIAADGLDEAEGDAAPPEPDQAEAAASDVVAPERYTDESVAEPDEWVTDTEDATYEKTPAIESGVSQAPLFTPGEEEETTSAAHATPEATSEEDEAMPQWLRDLRKQEKSEDLEPPAWLSDSYWQTEDEQQEDAPPQTGEDTAGWLAALSSPENAIDNEGIPDWLHEMDTSEEQGAPKTVSPEEEAIPSWLREMGDLKGDEESTGPAVEEAASSPAEGATTKMTEIPEQPAVAALDDTLAESLAPEAAEAPVVRPESTVPVRSAGTAQARPKSTREGPVVPTLEGTLAIESAITRLHAGPDIAEQAVPEDTELAGVFEEIVNEPLFPMVARVSQPRSRTRQTLGRILIYLLVIAAVVVPLYWQGALGLSYIDEHNIPTSAQTQNVYERINAIPEKETVLLIVDYEPGLAEELNAQARTLLRTFMRRQFRILVVSTSLTGPQVIQDIVDGLAAQSNGQYQYGRDYLNLGYLPGQETSLALFGHSPLSAVRVDFRDGKDLSSYVMARSLEAVPAEGFGRIIPLVVALSGNQENLRAWIEQVVAQNPGLNTIAGVSAGLEPYFLPYLKSRQIAGLLSGLVGAAEYEALSEQPARAIRSIDSQLAAHLLIVGLILIGNVAYALSRLTRRR